MADKNLRINISVTGAEKTRAEIKKTTQGIGNMRLTTTGLRREIGKLRNMFLLWMFAIKPAMKLIERTTAALFTQQKAEAKLRAALKNVTTATAAGADELIKYASALQRVTIFGDEEIISAAGILATFQLNEDAIGRILPRLLDMTTSYGDLESNALLLGKAFTGNAASLSRVGVQFDQMELAMARAKGSYAEFNFLIDSLDSNYKGLAQTLAETGFGQIMQLENEISDLNETLALTSLPVKKFGKSVELWLSKRFVDAQFALKNIKIMLDTLGDQTLPETQEKLKDNEEKWSKFKRVVEDAEAALALFKFSAAETNIMLENQLKVIKDSAKWWQIVSVIQHKNTSGLIKYGEITVANAGIESTLHPLREQQIRLENEIQSIAKQSNAIKLSGFKVSQTMLARHLELLLEQKKLENTIAVARIQHNAEFVGSLGAVVGEMKGGAKAAARLAQISAVIDAYASYNKMVAQGGLFGLAPAAVALATGLANVLKISNAIGDFGSAQFGMDQIVSKPTLILTGEQNKRERVQVTPLESPNLAGPSSGGVVVNINAPLVDETVRDSIMPSIQKALRSNAA